MAATEFRRIYFPKIQTPEGYLRISIQRVLNWTAGVNYYKWFSDHPTDTIYLDQRGFIGEKIGNIIEEYKDEETRAKLASRQIEFHDDFIFSGIDGAGTPVASYNLAADGKSFAQYFFKDKSDSAIYILWTELFDASGTLLKITFTGDIDKNNMPDQPLLLRNTENPSNLLRSSSFTMSCAPAYDRLTKYSARDIGIWNHFADGNTALAKTDMTATASDQCAPFWEGFEVVYFAEDGTPLDYAIGTNPNGVKATDNLVPMLAGIHVPNPVPWTNQHGLTTQSVFRDATGGGTINGVPVASFRNGFYGVSYATIISKISDFIGCDSSGITYADTVKAIEQVWDNSALGYTPIIVPFGITDINLVYNILFGINPFGGSIWDTLTGSGLTGTTSPSIGAVITVHTTLHTVSASAIPVDGMEVFIEGADDPAADGIWTIANAARGVVSGDSAAYSFELVRSVSTKTNGSPDGTFNYLFSSPVTYTANTKANDIIKEFCTQFHYKLKFGINQSGANIGMPFMKFVSRWAAGTTIPAHWKAGKIFGTQPTKVSSDCVKVSLIGDDSYVICPASHKLDPIEIKVRLGSHKWGEDTGVYGKNVLFNKDGRDKTSPWFDRQDSTAYTGSEDDFPLDDDGWIVGRVPYIKTNTSGIYPFNWSSSSQLGLTITDYDGFTAYAALIWHPSVANLTAPPSPNQYNPLFDLARLNYLDLVKNKQILQRDFARVKYTDDLTIDYEDSWQEGGAQVKYRNTRIEYNEITQYILTEWEKSPSNYTDLDSAPVCEFYNGGNSSGSSSGSSSSGSGAGGVPVGLPGQFIERIPQSVSYNTVIPPTDATLGLRIQGSSLTQSANLQEWGTWDATTFGLGISISPNGKETRFYNTAATHYTGLKGNGTITADITFTLPNADGLSNYLVKTNGSAVLGFSSIAALADAGFGILLSESGSHHVIIAVDTSVINTNNCVILAPGSDTRNVIFPPADWIGLTIKSNGVKDILRIKDSSNVILAAFNPEGLIVGDVAGAGTAVPLYARQMAGGTTVAAIFERSTIGTANDIIQIRDEAHTLLGAITAQGDLHIGDLTSYLSSTHIGTVNVIQKNTTSLGISWKQHDTTGSGINFLELYDHTDMLITRISPDGDFRSLNKGSFGSLTGSGADVHVEEATSGNVHLREVNNSVTNEHLLDQLQTTDNLWHVLHSWALANNHLYTIAVLISGLQSTNNNGKQWHGAGGMIVGTYRIVGGVITQVGNNNGVASDLQATPGFPNVKLIPNGANVELQVNGGGNDTVDWRLNNFSMLPVG